MRKLQSMHRNNLRATMPPCRPSGKHPVLFGLRLLPVILAVGAIFNAYTYLGQQIKDSDRMIAKYRKELNHIGREIEHLRTLEEKLSSRTYINRRIAHFHLNLQEPAYEQTQHLVIRSGNQPVPRAYQVGQR